MRFLQRFDLQNNDTTIKKEFIAGLTTFFAMLYIIPVNATIMNESGMPFSALVSVTALMTIIATVASGIWSNTPIAMSVGMGLNAYFSFGLVMGLKLPWQSALGVVFLSGVLYFIITLTPIRRWIINTIPLDIKRAASAGIGAFIALIGLKEMGVVIDSEATLVSIGNMHDPKVLFGLFGLLSALIFTILKLRAALILSIFSTSLTAWIIGFSPLPTHMFDAPASIAPIFMEMDLKAAFSLSLVPVIITFLVTDVFDTIGTLIDVGLRADLFKKEDTILLQKTMEADAAATVLSGVMGVTSTTAFIESAAGVEEGGKTGLTAVFTGVLFMLPLFFLPLFEAIPSFAIYPVLVIVGALMFSELGNIDYSDEAVKYTTFFIVLMMPLTYSITDGLMLGALVYVSISLVQKRFAVLKTAMGLMSVIGIFLLFMGTSKNPSITQHYRKVYNQGRLLKP